MKPCQWGFDLCVSAKKTVIIKVIYQWMNRFKPVIAFISLNNSHLEIDRQTYKGPLRSLYRVRTEIPALTFLSSMTTYNGKLSQPKMHGTKKKSL